MPVTDSSIYSPLQYITKILIRDISDIVFKFPNKDNKSTEELKKDLDPVIKSYISSITHSNNDPQFSKKIAEINLAIKRSRGILRDDWLETYIEEIFNKAITGRGDLHLRNLGITDYGTLSFFDPAHESFEKEIGY